MCRRDQIRGTAILAFGVGLLVSCWFETFFWKVCFGICMIGVGLLILGKK